MFKKIITYFLLFFLLLIFMFWQPPEGLSSEGWRTLGIILLAALLWISNIIPVSYASILIIFLFLITGTASALSVFNLWVSPLGWFIVGAFLLAGAINKTGVGEKLVLSLFGGRELNFDNMLILIYISQAITTIIIPHPIPRCLMLMTCFYGLIENNNLSKNDAAKIGFIIFSSAPPMSLIVMTGDIVLNLTTVTLSGAEITWMDWLIYMGVPGMIATLLTFLIHLKFFRVDNTFIGRGERFSWKNLSRQERVVVFAIIIAITGWATDFVHGIEPAWITLGVAACLFIPNSLRVLEITDTKRYINWPLLCFLTGALALGTVSKETGLAGWLVSTLLPEEPVKNNFVVGLSVGGLTMAVHMIISSVLATISVVTTPLIAFAEKAGWDPFATGMIVNVTSSLHYFLPFQNAAILMGVGQVGFFGQRETLRFGFWMTGVIIIIVIIQICWWQVLGLI